MALSSDQQKQLILKEFGKQNDAAFADLVLSWLALHEERAIVHPNLPYWLAKLAAIDYLRASNYETTDFKDDEVSISGNQISLNLQRLRDDVEGEIKALLGQAGATQGPVVGLLTRTSPIMPTDEVDYTLNPSGRQYRGDPLLPPPVERGW